MMMRLLGMVGFCATLGISIQVRGQEIYPFFRGVRAQGMGGAAVSVVDDETALLLNPAGLGKVRGPVLNINLQDETNFDTQEGMANNLGDINIISPQSPLDLGKKNPDRHLHAGVQTFPSFVTTNFGLGLFDKYSVDAQLTSATNLFQLNYFNDLGAVMGYCFRLFSGRVKIAFSGRILDRVYVNQTFPGSTATLTLSNIAREGLGAGWDGAVMLSAPWFWLPSITAVAHDVGGTVFTLAPGIYYPTAQAPPPQQQSVDVGIGLFPIFTNYSRASITVEYRNVLNVDNVDMWRALHAGVELDFNDVFFIRGGQNQHYWTAGLEFDLGHIQLQLASYGEEIGIEPNQSEDRRYVFEFAYRL